MTIIDHNHHHSQHQSTSLPRKWTNRTGEFHRKRISLFVVAQCCVRSDARWAECGGLGLVGGRKGGGAQHHERGMSWGRGRRGSFAGQRWGFKFLSLIACRVHGGMGMQSWLKEGGVGAEEATNAPSLFFSLCADAKRARFSCIEVEGKNMCCQKPLFTAVLNPFSRKSPRSKSPAPTSPRDDHIPL